MRWVLIDIFDVPYWRIVERLRPTAPRLRAETLVDWRLVHAGTLLPLDLLLAQHHLRACDLLKKAKLLNSVVILPLRFDQRNLRRLFLVGSLFRGVEGLDFGTFLLVRLLHVGGLVGERSAAELPFMKTFLRPWRLKAFLERKLAVAARFNLSLFAFLKVVCFLHAVGRRVLPRRPADGHVARRLG